MSKKKTWVNQAEGIFECEKCKEHVKWAKPYVKGQPPLDAYTSKTHQCPAFMRLEENLKKKEEKKTGEETGNSSSAKQFQKSGLEGRRVRLVMAGADWEIVGTFEGFRKFVDCSPHFFGIKKKDGKITYYNIQYVQKVEEID